MNITIQIPGSQIVVTVEVANYISSLRLENTTLRKSLEMAEADLEKEEMKPRTPVVDLRPDGCANEDKPASKSAKIAHVSNLYSPSLKKK